jgi:synaptobrevin family protein YKT6
MKITTLLVLKSSGDSTSTSGVREQQQQAVMLAKANASNVSHFGYFQRPAAREFILFAARDFILFAAHTVTLRRPPPVRPA